MLVLGIRLWLGSNDATAAAVATTTTLDSALVAWSASPPAQAMVDATRIPDARQRDWLVALRRAGTPVAWTTKDSSGGALVVEPAPLPESPSRITALAAPGAGLAISDELGRIDSARTGSEGIAEWRASPIAAVHADLGNAIGHCRRA